MENEAIQRAFAELSTPLVADACLRQKLRLRLAPPGISALPAGARVAGRALPVRHFGSVDVFLEVLESAGAGDILVIDNSGRLDEGCIGDLTVLEARAAEIAGVVVWGAHRDTAELKEIGLPVFSYGRMPAGPVRLDPRTPDALLSARFGKEEVRREDVVFGDADGVVFVAAGSAEGVLRTAREIWQKERELAQGIRAGRSLREQLQFGQYLAARANDPSLTLRQHLRKLGGAIEE